jgi:predicted  nucleic acid-binding Zn-ribbon protein
MMDNVKTILESLLELVRLDVQSRKTGKATAERRRLEEAINSVRAKVPEPILGHFDRQKSRGKLGIAPVRRGVCGACHLKIPLGHVAELRHNQEDLALCDNCGTYIYLPPDEMIVSPQPTPPARRARAGTPLMHV